MVSTVFTMHTCAGTGVMPILAFYPTSDFLIHLSLFSKSFYFCTDLETAGKIFLTKILKSQIPIKRKKRGGATSDNPETCNAEFPFNLENWHESLKPPTALKKKKCPVMYTDDRDDLESSHWEPKIHVITARRLLCTFLLWLHFNSKKNRIPIPS